MTIDDGYAIQREWVKTRAGRRARRQGPQDRSRRRARCSRRRRSTSPISRRSSTTCSSRRRRHPVDRFIAPRVEVELAFVLGAAARRPGRDARRRARRDRRTSSRRSRSSMRASSNSTATRRRRARCSTRSPTSPPTPASCGRPPVRPERSTCAGSARSSYKNGIVEETGLAAGVLESSGHRRRLARAQDRGVRRAVERRPRRPRRLVHPPVDGVARRRLPRRLRAARRDRVQLHVTICAAS